MKALASASLLFLAACHSNPLRLADGGATRGDSGTHDDASCGDLQTDDHNCGRCGNVCSAIAPSTARCAAGRCLTSLVSQDWVPSIVVAQTGVYWLTTLAAADAAAGAALWRTGLEGGEPAMLTTQYGDCYKPRQPGASRAYCTPLYADATSLYLTGGYSEDDYVVSMPLDGSSEPAFLAGRDWFKIYDLTADASNVYWSTCYKDSYIKRVPLGVKSEPIEVATNTTSCPTNLVPHDGSLYWLVEDFTTSDVEKTWLMKIAVSEAGAQPLRLLKWRNAWGRFAVGDVAIYWTDVEQGSLMALPLAGGSSPSTVVTGLDSPRDVAVSDDYLYWASYAGGTIMKRALADGAITVLASGQSQPHGIVVDRASVYWISTDGGRDTVMKLTPK